MLENTAPWDAFSPRATETKHIEKTLRIQPIKTFWRERVFNEHSVGKFDKVAQRQLIDKLTTEGTLPNVGPTAIEAPSMDDVLVFDLETASSEENAGIFETYAIGWRTSTESCQLIAQTKDDLKGGLLQRFLDLLKVKGAEVAALECKY